MIIIDGCIHKDYKLDKDSGSDAVCALCIPFLIRSCNFNDFDIYVAVWQEVV